MENNINKDKGLIAETLDLSIKQFVDSRRGTVMDDGEFSEFVNSIYLLADTYVATAQYLSGTPPQVRRVANGGKSDILRKVLGIKKGNRMRQCYECTPETRHNVKLLREETGLSGLDLHEDMVDVYFEHLERGSY